MGHCVRALIGSAASLRKITDRYGVSQVVDLPQGFAILPLLGELYDALEDAGKHGLSAGEPFVSLKPKVGDLLVSYAGDEWLVYFETDYFGGVGTQGAVVARNGKVAFGPATGEGTINSALQLIGVSKGSSRDEFEALGLGDRRSTEDWLDDPDYGSQ